MGGEYYCRALFSINNAWLVSLFVNRWRFSPLMSSSEISRSILLNLFCGKCVFFNSMNFYTKGKLDYYKSISLTDFHAIPMMLNFMNIHEMSRRRVNNMATSIFSNDLPSKFIQTNLHNTKTKERTENACNILKDFCAARGEVGGQIERLNEEELGELLCDFYANVRSKDGEIYKKSSMPAIRSGLNRHLKTPPHSKPFTIITDPAFVSANNVLKAMLRKIQSEGKRSF